MHQRKKVLIVENSLYITGALNAILAVTNRLKEEFEFVYVIPAKSVVEKVIKDNGYNVFKIPFLELSKSPSAFLYIPKLYSNAKALLKIVKSESIDIVHVNDIYNLVGCMMKKLYRPLKLVYHIRLLKNSYIGPLYSFFASQVKKYADAVICVSEAVKNDFGDRNNLRVIYDSPDIKENYAAWQGLKNPEALRIFYLGNYTKGKGQDYGLQAFIDFQKLYPQASLTFAGAADTQASKDFKEELKNIARAAEVFEKVIFNDKSTDVEKDMKSHDVVLNLSESESFSFVCLESLFYGVPLIAANSGGPADVTDYGQMGSLVANKDASAGCDALKELVKNPGFVMERSRKAKIWATEKFNIEKTIIEIKEVYNSL